MWYKDDRTEGDLRAVAAKEPLEGATSRRVDRRTFVV
jgi:hypothetical protein